MPPQVIDPTILLDPLDVHPAMVRIEASLGLTHPPLAVIDQLLRYATAIDQSGPLDCSASFQADRLGTTRQLMRRRDEALLAGWDGTSTSPSTLTSLAAIETRLRGIFPDGIDTLADRTRAIEQAFAAGLVVTVGIRLQGSESALPTRWRALLDRLRHLTTVSSEPEQVPGGLPATSLGRFQRGLSGTIALWTADTSLAVAQVGSRSAAAQAIAALLASRPPAELEETVIVCHQADLVVAIDDRLRRAGIPGLGAPAIGRHTALDGVLPVALGLCWEPVDADLLLELCMLPGGPLGSTVGTRLAGALTQFPGLGSRSWTHTRAELTTPSEDPDGSLQKRLDQWFDHARVPMGQPAPAQLLVERCAVVARWAGVRMSSAETPKDSPYAALAGAAARVGSALEMAGTPQTPSNLARLIAEASIGSASTRHQANAGGALLVATPADIPASSRRVLWVDPAAPESSGTIWTATELTDLQQAGLPMDDGMALSTARRAADRNGLCRICDALVVIEVAGNDDARQHPAVIALRQGLAQGGLSPDQVPRLDDLQAQPTLTLAGWSRQGVTISAAPAHGPRPLWAAPGAALSIPETSSYSELSVRLACPLAWTLKYALGLFGGPTAALPATHQLEGTFAHSVLEGVFGGPLPDPAKAASAAVILFDQRISIDAAPLASPGLGARRVRLRQHVAEAARTLATALRAAGCTTVAMEAPIDARRDGIALKGSIDCLATGTGLAVVIDIKLGSLRERRSAIQEGRAIQLAVYAASRSENRIVTGYYIINGPRLLTAGDDPIPGIASLGPVAEAVDGGPGWQQTWSRFRMAVVNDHAWQQGQTIPARPLEEPSAWPSGAELVLSATAEVQDCCTYCDYSILCGRKGCR